MYIYIYVYIYMYIYICMHNITYPAKFLFALCLGILGAVFFAYPFPRATIYGNQIKVGPWLGRRT